MVEITELLLRKRSEHNEGQLSNLKEITLHQFEIESINEVLGIYCRELQILYLQNNLIRVIQNLHHLKDLRYLNLAVNNITSISGLGSNEHLEKLDLTANFVWDLLSVESLRENYKLREMHLLGNPCTTFENYRLFVIGAVPSLQILDGERVAKSERILAEQLKEQIKKSIEEEQSRINVADIQENIEQRDQDKKEMAEHKNAKEKAQEKNLDGINEVDGLGLGKRVSLTPEEEIEKYGKVMQKNEGKWAFKLLQEKDHYVLDIPAGKYMSLSYVDIDVQPTFVRVTIKGKVLQLRFDREVNSSNASAQRSTTTGNIVIKIPYSTLNP
ncbi:hypothetical protein NAEGRDRAFT_31069 [Naegleria gruberi]|uniref:Dynein axonemal assembly factor 11-like CS domain-containing protein n=1 Tax=Naegleria gruberi TaxID=5762 RepID=D2V4X8_NAEGR|nr:uncharacterized protein NAEGRDRAFT_31069 [Naegleria gruberi]EFC48009.1 hypothetical protein NAEGRDRAFT_31069 [Naegleria gruberi]|eukprot:XP_002680753.1 hypothetical protein NAEGRDRAFT_31069 [Naegleria gruberi strain NEG-M]